PASTGPTPARRSRRARSPRVRTPWVTTPRAPKAPRTPRRRRRRPPPPRHRRRQPPPPPPDPLLPVRRPLVEQPLFVALRPLAPALVGVVAGLLRQYRPLLVVERHLALVVRRVSVHGP